MENLPVRESRVNRTELRAGEMGIGSQEIRVAAKSVKDLVRAISRQPPVALSFRSWFEASIINRENSFAVTRSLQEFWHDSLIDSITDELRLEESVIEKLGENSDRVLQNWQTE